MSGNEDVLATLEVKDGALLEGVQVKRILGNKGGYGASGLAQRSAGKEGNDCR